MESQVDFPYVSGARIQPKHQAPQIVFIAEPGLKRLDELMPYHEQTWDTKVLTNGGPFNQRLESVLREYLGVLYISLFANATITLITALKALDIQGEVITMPYCFVATEHSELWIGIILLFVLIDPVTINIDPTKIEADITFCTTSIMPVHIYSHPCNVDAIEAIAKWHNLKVIYDAAHALGV